MATRREKVWAGAFVVAGVALIGLSLALLAGIRLGGDHDDLYAIRFTESVAGLESRSIVRYNGVPIGRVRAIELDQEQPGAVRVTIAANKGTKLPHGTSATLGSSGITGMLYIELSYTKGERYRPRRWRGSATNPATNSATNSATAPSTMPDAEPANGHAEASAPATTSPSAAPLAKDDNPEYLVPGDLIPARLSLLGQLSESLRGILNEENPQGIQSLIRHYDDLAQNANRLMDDAQGVRRLIKHYDDLALAANAKLDTFADAAKRIDEIGKDASEMIASWRKLMGENDKTIREAIEGAAQAAKAAPALVTKITAVVDENREAVRVAMANLAKVSGELQQKVAEERVTELVARLNKTTERADAALAGVQSVVAANEQTLNETLANLRDSTRSLKELTERLRHDPSLIVRGRGGADKEIPDR
ncbi:MAG: MlaD family protein [Planctomycetota bacterium]|nr:MlaD family protein [Planctomycetota bacterium]